MQSKFPSIALLLLAFAAGIFLTRWYYGRNSVPIETADVLLEKIQSVRKLVTVEGQFSEIYNYDNYQGNFPMFWDKKALVRVKAKVSAGYDLHQVQFETDEATRTLYIRNLPKATILSIDHQLDYYNITEGLFTGFSQADHNLMQARAKQFIREKAEQSSLLANAEQEGRQTLEMIAFMVRGMGWTVEIEGTTEPPLNE